MHFGVLELMWEDDVGNRSSVEESSNGANGPEDETTVVEPEQGNGMPSNAPEKTTQKLMIYCSPLTHHIAAAARRRPEPGRTPNIYIGAAEYAGKNH
jgi:hypothetical protein